MKNETKKPAPVKCAEIAAKAAAIAKAKTAFTPPAKAPAPAKPADKPKPEAAKPAPAPKPTTPPAKPAAPSDDETGRAWRDMANRHAVEMAALGLTATPPKGVPCVRFVSGLYVPVAKAADYRATVDRHREERAKMRDVPATARGVYREELRTFKGDEIAALYELGLPHIADKAGIAVPVIRGNRALAEAWRSALEDVAPGKVSQIVTVRALGKPKPQTAPQTAPAAQAPKPTTPQKAPPKPATAAASSKGKSTAPTAAKPSQAAQKPADEKPKGLGMVAKIEAKADAKPAKAKPKK